MNRNIEIIRDTLAGALLGAVAAVAIFLLSLIKSLLFFLGGLIIGSGTFEIMQGDMLTLLIVVFIIVGAAIGGGIGYYWTQEDVIIDNINKWMSKYNK